MKIKNPLTLTLVTLIVSSCGGTSSLSLSEESLSSSLDSVSSSEQSISSSSYSDPYSESLASYSSSSFNFSTNFSGKRKLSEYTTHREFFADDLTAFEGTILNPANYAENPDAEIYYRPSVEPIGDPVDYSTEVITFGGASETLSTTVASLAEGALTNESISLIMNDIQTNDDIITRVSNHYQETILYNAYFYGDYYVFNNYHRVEDSISTRYSTPIIDGNKTGRILFQDGFFTQFIADFQIQSTGFKIYELYDETFPVGSTLAKDTKASSTRVEGNYKQALLFGGGGMASRWIDKYSTQFAEYTAVENPYASNYAYEISGVKTATETTINFTASRAQFEHSVDGLLFEMELEYSITISNGIVSAIDGHQIFWSTT